MKTLIAIIVFLISANCMAQDNYIVKTNGDTLHCKIRKVTKKGIYYLPVKGFDSPKWILNGEFTNYDGNVVELKSSISVVDKRPVSICRRKTNNGVAMVVVGAVITGGGVALAFADNGNEILQGVFAIGGFAIFCTGIGVLTSAAICSIKAKKQRKTQTALSLTGNGLSLSYKF